MSKHICFVNSAFGRDDALIVHRNGKSLLEAGYRMSYLCQGKGNEKFEVKYSKFSGTKYTIGSANELDSFEKICHE